LSLSSHVLALVTGTPCCRLPVLPYVQGRRQVKICRVDRRGERRARAYNEGLGAERPPPPSPYPL